MIQITPQIGGTVIAIMADDTDFVKAGQPLVQLDPADARVALEQAEAALAGIAHSGLHEKNQLIVNHAMHAFFSQPALVCRG